jgi:hypothetical protein
VGRAGRDAEVLAAAEWLGRLLPAAPVPSIPG